MPICELRIRLLKLGANIVPICSNTADENHVNSHVLIEVAYRALLQGFLWALGKADHSSMGTHMGSLYNIEFERCHRSKRHAVNALATIPQYGRISTGTREERMAHTC